MTETFAEAWRQRFGQAPPVDLPELSQLARHRSVRKYSDRPIDEPLVKCLIGTAQGAATSSNLQLWSVISIQQPETREELAKLADNYQHIRDCQWFFAFIADHYRLKTAASQVGEDAEGLDYEEFFIMSVIDVALAAERFVCAAESLGLGICYIGAMRNNAPEVKRILGLPDQTFCTFGLCLGWPEEPLAAHVKPRLSQDAVWFRERYECNVAGAVSEYNERMRSFYEAENMKGSVTWSMRSGRRVDNYHLTGREILKTWLEQQGFNLR